MTQREDGVFGGELPPASEPPATQSPPTPPTPPTPPKGRSNRGWWLLLIVLLAVGTVAVLRLRQASRPVQQEQPAPEVSDETGTRSVTVYFGSYDGEGVVAENRTIASRAHREEEVEAVVNEILRGPQTKQAVKLFPDGTRLRRAFYDEENRLLYLDFTSALVGGQIGGSTMEILTLTTLLRTIAVDFPEVLAVQLLVDGQEVETLAGHIDLTRPLRAKDWL